MITHVVLLCNLSNVLIVKLQIKPLIRSRGRIQKNRKWPNYHGKLLEYYRKGGKPTTIQKDVVIICLKTLLPLDNDEQPKDPPEFAIVISVVTSALLEDGTDIPSSNLLHYSERWIRVPRISIRPSPHRKLAMTLSYV